MKKTLPIQINIPTPCSEDWDKMTPCEQGRFCAHCQKRVIDFTRWSDTDLYHFLSKNDTLVCGRFTSYQLNRPIHIPYQPHSRLYRIAIGLSLTLIFAQVPEANAQKKPPFVIEQTPGSITKNNSVGAIDGQILDHDKHPLSGAKIEIIEANKIKGNTVTDRNGIYLLKSVDPGKYNVKISYTGYTPRLVTGIIVGPGKTIKINASLKTQITALDPISVVAYKVPLISNCNWGSNEFRNSGITGALQIRTNEITPQKKPDIARELNSIPQTPNSPRKKDAINLDPYEPTKTIFTSEQIEKQ